MANQELLYQVSPYLTIGLRVTETLFILLFSTVWRVKKKKTPPVTSTFRGRLTTGECRGDSPLCQGFGGVPQDWEI
jgi:hypothetical protein